MSLRLKTYLFALGLFLAAYLIVPSILDFQSIREQSEAVGETPPWYVQIFPDKQINLGLDLRGGIYLELEVGLEEALIQRSQITAGEIERELKDQGITFKSISVLPKSTILSLQLQKPDDLNTVRNLIRDRYDTSYEEIRANDDAVTSLLESTPSPNTLFYQPSDVYLSRLKDQTVRQAVETIRNRIDRHGVAEPAIQRLGENRVVVEMPGVKDPDRAIALIKRAGKLEFKLVDDSLSDSKVAQLVKNARTDNKIPEGFTLETVDKINEALKGKIPADTEIVFQTQYDPISKEIVGGNPYLLKRKVDISGEMLRNAQVSVQNNQPYVSLSFNPAGTKAFADLTQANVGKRLAILLDGTVNKAPVIKEPILSGEAQIELGFGNYQALIKEAEDLVVVLREGALPASLTEATKTVIGPSLGKASIDRGFKAMLLAGTVVIIFMAFWYKRGGILADGALILNILFIFAFLTLFGATLTLPGVAGIVLTIGMAVDANVIILERIKEELVSGKAVKAAVDAGYGNAMSAIVDANITTFLAGVVLYQFGTGPVRGFAVTLMIGIITTLITALFITRLVYDLRIKSGKLKTLSL